MQRDTPHQCDTNLKLIDSWLLEYDSATFASYVNTLQRQHFYAQKHAVGAGKHVHDWFNARAATMLVEASQARVSRKRAVMDNEPEEGEGPDGTWSSRAERERSGTGAFEDDEQAMRDMGMDTDEDMESDGIGASGGQERRHPQNARELREEEEDEDVMEAIATQSAALAQAPGAGWDGGDDSDDELQQVTGTDGGLAEHPRNGNGSKDGEQVAFARPPPVFRAVNFDQDEVLRRSVARRLRKGHEPVLEELPKWSLLAKVLKEIEDTMARIKTTHAGKLFMLCTDALTLWSDRTAA